MVGNYWPPTLESSVVDVCSQRKRLSAPPFSTRVCDCLYRYRTLLDIYIFDVYHSFFFGGKRATGIHTSSYQVRYQDTINTCHLSTLNTIYLPYFTVLRTSHKRTCGLVACCYHSRLEKWTAGYPLSVFVPVLQKEDCALLAPPSLLHL